MNDELTDWGLKSFVTKVQLAYGPLIQACDMLFLTQAEDDWENYSSS